MNRFGEVLDRLVFMPSRNGKLALIVDYLRSAPDPDRGYMIAALCGDLKFPAVKRSAVSDLVGLRVDPELYRMSRDFVGDTAETAALIWPSGDAEPEPPGLDMVVATLLEAKRQDAVPLLEAWMDRMEAKQRWALLKLVTGGLRIGVSARLAKQALAQFGAVDIADIEQLWHGLEAPYLSLFCWLEGRGPRPEIDLRMTFHPLMLANPIGEAEIGRIDPAHYSAEWKWDGIRVQVAASEGNVRLYSRTGDDISAAFPELIDHFNFDAVLDGELLVKRDGIVAPFNDLQQRLNRKSVSAAMIRKHPGHVRFYDILFDGGEDLRSLTLDQRRTRLEAWYETVTPPHSDLSEVIPFAHVDDLFQLREQARERNIEGLMIKRRDSPYVAGRPKGPWFKWKRDPLCVDAVLMYAQRGSGKRSSYYSDYTFGTWRPTEEGRDVLVPVGKAYSGFTDDELLQLDKWVRDHTTNRFGPVREVEAGLVLEVVFDAVHRSKRHKSGVAMRFPRIRRIRWDKPAREADGLETLLEMLEDRPPT